MQLDFSKFPKLNRSDVDEKVTKGSGPGGQSVNKTSNAVQLKHLPTGVVVKVHQTRSLDRNRKIAWERLAEVLLPDGTFELTSATNLRKKIVTCIWYSNNMFRYTFKIEFVTLVSLKVPLGSLHCSSCDASTTTT